MFKSRASFQNYFTLLQSRQILMMINLALIGVGEWGKHYLSTIKNFSDCKVKYVCVRTPERLKLFSGDFIKTTNFRDLLKYKDIDGVIIATPGSTHFGIAKEFLEKGFNLLIEKPLTLKYDQALELAALKDQTIAKVMVGHIYLFDPAYLKAKTLMKKLGTIKYVSYEAVNNGPYRNDMSVLWDLGPHAAAFLLDIFEQSPTQVTAWAVDNLRPKSRLWDIVFINFKFSNYSQAFIKISWLFPVKRRELVIAGNKSTLCYNDLIPHKLTLYEDMGPRLTGGIAVRENPQIKHPAYQDKLPLEMELQEFVNAIRENKSIQKSDLDFGVKITKLLHFAEQSILDDGKVINVSL